MLREAAMRVIPWITDETVTFVINFIEEFKTRNKRFPTVLEFGMGSSSLFFGSKCSRLVSFEHDPAWHAKTCAIMDLQGWSHEAHLIDRPYSAKIEEIVGDSKFDIILIDGRDRVACLEELLRIDPLAKDGVLVIDNTERIFDDEKKYKPMLDLLDPSFRIVHFQQNGRDRTGWTPRVRWMSTVTWKKDGIQFTNDGFRLEEKPKEIKPRNTPRATKVIKSKARPGIAGLPQRLVRSIRKRLPL